MPQCQKVKSFTTIALLTERGVVPKCGDLEMLDKKNCLKRERETTVKEHKKKLIKSIGFSDEAC